MFSAATVIAEYFDISAIDLNMYLLPEGTVLRITEDGSLYTALMNSGLVEPGPRTQLALIYGLPPRLMLFGVIAGISIALASRGRCLLLDQAQGAADHARVEKKLSVASQIQSDTLPCIFPAFPEHEGLDIFATMTPAKEVGADFYDYFRIDDDHIAIVMADVSGKGVPAALFMMKCPTRT